MARARPFAIAMAVANGSGALVYARSIGDHL
jgi:hypothetical protein